MAQFLCARPQPKTSTLRSLRSRERSRRRLPGAGYCWGQSQLGPRRAGGRDGH